MDRGDEVDGLPVVLTPGATTETLAAHGVGGGDAGQHGERSGHLRGGEPVVGVVEDEFCDLQEGARLVESDAGVGGCAVARPAGGAHRVTLRTRALTSLPTNVTASRRHDPTMASDASTCAWNWVTETT